MQAFTARTTEQTLPPKGYEKCYAVLVEVYQALESI